MESMHPYDRVNHSRIFAEGLAEITLALMESPDPCDKSLVVLHEVSSRMADELSAAMADLDGTVPVRQAAKIARAA